jgi:hypothetical protein
MNAELEEILKAFDAFRQELDDTEAARLEVLYERRLDDVLSRNPQLSEETLQRLVETEYRKWLTAQKKPTALPPTA